jgi:two-component system sensor histidine kinase/response regulator
MLLSLTSLACALGVLLIALCWWRGQQHEQQHLRQRVRELEELLVLQDRKVKHLTAFAEQVQESEAGTRAIIENALDGIITIDHNGGIIEFNPAAEKLFGFERESLLGKSIAETIIPPSLREMQRRGWEQFLATGYGPWIGPRVETVALRADGQEFPIELAITVLHPQQPPLLTAYVRDLSQLKHTAEKLSQSNSRLQAVLDAATQAAIIATNASGHITLFNRGAERMLGYRAEEVMGDHTLELFLAASELASHTQRLTEEFGIPFEGFAALVERARCQDHEEREWTFVRKNGSSLTVNLAVTVIRDDRGDVSGYLAVATDVTSRRRAALALERAKEAAEAANRAKSDFLANMSHEIRTPMNGILGMTQLALDTDLTAEQREYLQMVKTSADGLLTVINDILDFSKIEAGKLELDPIDFELRDMLADTVRSLSLRAYAKDLELACHVDANVPEFLVGDPARLRQVLLNLVGNAIKFTERGEVVVHVGLANADGKATQTSPAATLKPGGDIELHFAVTDTGIGIPPEKLPYIFDAFMQADSSTTRKYGGTGLGLTISGRLVEIMGGRLRAESTPGEGSTFYFSLRLKLQDLSPSRLLPRRPLDLQGLRVLVVDDNATNRRILEDLLSSWLMKPMAVENARMALAELEAAAKADAPFPLVLLDAHMPGEDGFTLASEIRARTLLGAPGLVLLSSASRVGDRERCEKLCIHQRLTKPVKPSDLLNAILCALETQGQSESVAAAPPVPPSLPSPSGREANSNGSANGVPVARSKGETKSALPNGGLRVLLAEDNLVNQRLIWAVLEKQGHRISTVANGAAAVRAVQQEAFDVVLMDVQMPEMNGLEATRAIRAWEQQQGGHVPIIAMSAHAMKGAREDCLEAGMDEYLSKPLQMPEVLRTIAEVTKSGKEKPAAARPARFDLRPMLRRLNDDSDLFRELIHLFQEDCPRMLETLRAAVESGNAESVEHAAHQLKGAVSNFAAVDVVQAAQNLELLGRHRDLGEAGDAYRALEQSLDGFRASLDEWLTGNPV